MKKLNTIITTNENTVAKTMNHETVMKVQKIWKDTMDKLQKEAVMCLNKITETENSIQTVMKSLNDKYIESGYKMPQTDLGLKLLDKWLGIVEEEMADVGNCKQDADMLVGAMLADGRIEEVMDYIEDESYDCIWWLETAGSKMHRLTTILQGIGEKWNLPTEHQEAAQKSIKEANDHWNQANNCSTYLSDLLEEVQTAEDYGQAVNDYVKQHEEYDYGYWQWGDSCEEDFVYDMNICMDSLA